MLRKKIRKNRTLAQASNRVAKKVAGARTQGMAPQVGDYAMLIKPIVTEKSSQIGHSGNTIVFSVPTTATKPEIIAAVQRVFKVDVAAVRTMNIMGKPKRTKGALGRRAAMKKAYVSLKAGQKIDLIEGV